MQGDTPPEFSIQDSSLGSLWRSTPIRSLLLMLSRSCGGEQTWFFASSLRERRYANVYCYATARGRTFLKTNGFWPLRIVSTNKKLGNDTQHKKAPGYIKFCEECVRQSHFSLNYCWRLTLVFLLGVMTRVKSITTCSRSSLLTARNEHNFLVTSVAPRSLMIFKFYLLLLAFLRWSLKLICW